MKKIIYVFTTIIIMIAMIGTANFSAFAETTKYWEPRPNCQDALSYVNGEINYSDIDSTYDRDKDEITLTYTGKGTTNSWEFPLSQEGKDYKIISQKGNSITIKLINENHELPYINALVDFGETTTLANKAAIEQTRKQSKQNTENKTSTTIKETTETTTDIADNTMETIKNEITSEVTTNADEKTDKKNTNKIIVPCVIACAAGLVITAIVLKKKSKK